MDFIPLGDEQFVYSSPQIYNLTRGKHSELPVSIANNCPFLAILNSFFKLPDGVEFSKEIHSWLKSWLIFGTCNLGISRIVHGHVHEWCHTVHFKVPVVDWFPLLLINLCSALSFCIESKHRFHQDYEYKMELFIIRQVTGGWSWWGHTGRGCGSWRLWPSPLIVWRGQFFQLKLAFKPPRSCCFVFFFSLFTLRMFFHIHF